VKRCVGGTRRLHLRGQIISKERTQREAGRKKRFSSYPRRQKSSRPILYISTAECTQSRRFNPKSTSVVVSNELFLKQQERWEVFTTVTRKFTQGDSITALTQRCQLYTMRSQPYDSSLRALLVSVIEPYLFFYFLLCGSNPTITCLRRGGGSSLKSDTHRHNKSTAGHTWESSCGQMIKCDAITSCFVPRINFKTQLRFCSVRWGENSGIVPRLGHDSFLPDSFQLITDYAITSSEAIVLILTVSLNNHPKYFA
jgi:hypothetical protein